MVRPGSEQGVALSARAARFAYLALAVGLLAAMVSQSVVQTADGSWTGDFWEHSAVVRELSHHLLEPVHPLLGIDAPHAFFSPYAVALGVVARITSASPDAVLAGAGIVNLLLLLSVLPRFVRLFTTQTFAPFLVLVFTLVLWGPRPLLWSGFLHFGVIGLVLPYPSTFATALTLLAAVLWVRHLERPSVVRLALVGSIAAVVLLTHPVAALFLLALIGAFSLQGEPRRSSLVVVAGCLAAAAVVWPYYPFFRLVGESSVFDESNRALYEASVRGIAPALVAVALMPARLRTRRWDPLVVTFTVLVAVYVAGHWTERWSLGRVLPYIVLLLHIVLADRIAAVTVRSRAAVAAAVAVAVLAVAWPLMPMKGPVAQILPHGVAVQWADPLRREGVGGSYQRLFRGTPRNAVTLATDRVGWEVPSHGGWIVATQHPQAFIPELERRDRDVAAFFDPTTPMERRRRLLCRYGVSFILLDGRGGGVSASTLAPAATVFRRAGHYVLLRVRATCGGEAGPASAGASASPASRTAVPAG